MPSYVRTLNTTYEEVDVTTIKTHPANPRRGDLDVIKDSISVNGFYGSVVVNKRTSHILAGNHRYMAAKALGYDKVPVTWVDVGEHEEKRILTADNRTSELGGYDEAILVDLLKELSDEGMLEGTGYGADDLDFFTDDDEILEAVFGTKPEEGAEAYADADTRRISLVFASVDFPEAVDLLDSLIERTGATSYSDAILIHLRGLN